MTTLTKPVRRRVSFNVSGFAETPFVVTLTKEGLTFREHPAPPFIPLLPYRHGYFQAIRLEVARRERDEAAAKKAKRSTRSGR